MRWASLLRQAVQAGMVYRRSRNEVYALASSSESLGLFRIYIDTQHVPVRRASMGPGASEGTWVDDRLVLYVREPRRYAVEGLEEIEVTAIGLCSQLLAMNIPVIGFSWEWEHDVAAHDPGGSLDTSVARIIVELSE